MIEDPILTILPKFAVLTSVVWASTEFLPRALSRTLGRMPKEFTALLMGLSLGPAAVWAGLLDVTYSMALVGGFISAVLGGYVNDKLVKPVIQEKTP